MNACSQDAAGSVTEMLKEARTISQAFGAVAEGGNRQVQKYKALLNAWVNTHMHKFVSPSVYQHTSMYTNTCMLRFE